MIATKQRKYWLDTMIKIAEPVLSSLAQRKLKEKLPTEFNSHRSQFAYLEAFGRLACGIAPWIELNDLKGEEEQLRSKYEQLMMDSLDAATDPNSPDYMDFITKGQPLVDTAFLAHALLRAPNNITAKLDDRVRNNLISAFKKTRKTANCSNNWLFFSAMVEAGLYLLGDQEYDKMRIGFAIHLFKIWYKGDGIYGDGKDFHWDYYNSFVIQPMQVDLIKLFEQDSPHYAELKPIILNRAQRYATILERFIAPDGTYPAIGRSLTYRFGAFQLLSQVALQQFLDEQLQPSQVRCALTAVIQRIMEAPGNFDENGWLRPGLYGYQPGLAEGYINTGSLYLCAAVFLPLGLSPENEFWSAPNAKWTAQKIVSGEDIEADHAIND
ncbi:DUF2264 domain-containing protein [Bacillus sp. FJAT-28004]|uniref:DUF2264 domain-containing protein n=1 Tax=Bacillus sp. FJAT-28004 TaxID=1679165 RepID=UPI0006B55BD9|nr:DUF2264 domain-containing protein [Bacillus sp. FJAT-28004]